MLGRGGGPELLGSAGAGDCTQPCDDRHERNGSDHDTGSTQKVLLSRHSQSFEFYQPAQPRKRWYDHVYPSRNIVGLAWTHSKKPPGP